MHDFQRGKELSSEKLHVVPSCTHMRFCVHIGTPLYRLHNFEITNTLYHSSRQYHVFVLNISSAFHVRQPAAYIQMHSGILSPWMQTIWTMIRLLPREQYCSLRSSLILVHIVCNMGYGGPKADDNCLEWQEKG